MALWDNPNAWPVVDFDSPLGKVAQYNNLSDAVQRWRGNVNANNKALDNLVATTYRLSAVTGSQAGVSVQNRSGNNRFLISANAAAASGGSDYTDFIDHDIATKKTFTNGAWQMNGAVVVNNLLTTNNAFVPGQINTPSLTNGAGSPINFQDSFLDRVYAMQFKCLNPASNNIVAGSAPLLNFQVIATGGNTSGVNDRLIFYGITKVSDTSLSSVSLMELWRDSSLVRFPTTTLVGTAVGAVGSVQITGLQNSPVSGRLLFGGDGSGWQFRIASNRAGTITDMMSFVDSNLVNINSPTVFGSSVDIQNATLTAYAIKGWVNDYVCRLPSSTNNPGGASFTINAAGGAKDVWGFFIRTKLSDGSLTATPVMEVWRDPPTINFPNNSLISVSAPVINFNRVSFTNDTSRYLSIQQLSPTKMTAIFTDQPDTAPLSRTQGLLLRAGFIVQAAVIPGQSSYQGDQVIGNGDLMFICLNSQLSIRMRGSDGVVRNATINMA